MPCDAADAPNIVKNGQLINQNGEYNMITKLNNTTKTAMKVWDETIAVARALLATQGRLLQDSNVTDSQIMHAIDATHRLTIAAEQLHCEQDAAWFRLAHRYFNQESRRRINLQSRYPQ